MRILTSTLFIAALLFAGSSHAVTVDSTGQAMSLCTAEAKAQNDDYVSSKSAQIKRIRTGYRMKLRVVLNDKSVRAKCVVARDGTVTYTQK